MGLPVGFATVWGLSLRRSTLNDVAGPGEGSLLLGRLQVTFNHHLHQFRKTYLRSPSEFLAGLAGIPAKDVDFGGAKIAGIGFHIFPPVKAAVRGRQI